MGPGFKKKSKWLIEVRSFGVALLACVIALATGATCFATTVSLQWNAASDPSVAGYKVYYKSDSAVAPFNGTGATQGASPVNVSTATSATISGLDPLHAYYFAVTAYNSAGVESAYSNIASIPEMSPPTVAITYPGNNTTGSGTISVTASASDNVGVAKVEFYLNGVLKATDTSTPYLYSWDTTSVAAGSYTLVAKAYDAAGNVGTSGSVAVNVVNDTSAPAVSLTAPGSGATVSGTVAVTASASDNVGVAKVEFYQDGTLLSASNVAPYSYSWNTSGVANGSHTLSVKAYDAAGNVGQSAGVSVTVSNTVADSTAPSVSLTAPANGSTVSGTVAVSASASDNVGVSRVEFYVNGALQATDSAAPYTFSWNTAALANGSYTLSARAYDAAGNLGQSGSLSVAVNNPVAPPPGSYTAVLGNVSGATLPNTVQDTFLNINSDVNAASATLSTYTWPANTPANAIVMQWDLSGLPANAQIQSATLSLYQSGAGGDSSYQIPVSGLINKTPVLSKCNGSTYDGVNAWTASSIPYGGIPLAQSDIAAAVDAPLVDQSTGYKNWNVTSIVAGWMANPASNRGLLLDSSNQATSDSYRSFASSEAADATQRPKLTVTYTLGSTSDTTAPTVSLTAPTSGAAVSGSATVTASASDNVGIAKVEFYVNGALQATDTASPYSFSWNTAAVANGSYTLSAKAYDAAGNVGQSANLTVNVSNQVADTTAPAVTVASPLAGSKVGSYVTISASATDNVAVTKMALYIDNVLKKTVTGASLSYSWSTRYVATGAHTITVKAYDAANNVGTKSLTVNK